MREQEVPVPVEVNGCPSLDAQKEIVEQAKFIFDLKNSLKLSKSKFQILLSRLAMILPNF